MNPLNFSLSQICLTESTIDTEGPGTVFFFFLYFLLQGFLLVVMVGSGVDKALW